MLSPRLRWRSLAATTTIAAAACTSDAPDVSPGTGGRLVPYKPPHSLVGSGGQAGGGQAGDAGQGQAGEGQAGEGQAGEGQAGEGQAGDGQAGDAGQGGAGSAGSAGGGQAGLSGASGQSGQAGAGGKGGAGQAGAAGKAGAAGAAGKAGAGQAGSGGQPTAAEDKAATLAHLNIACDHPLDATFYATATAPSPWSADERGDVARCGYDRLVSLDEVKAALSDAGAPDEQVSSGVHKLRVVYWTEDASGAPILTSAMLLMPEKRQASGPSPLVVLAHGSVGVADKCAPSLEDPDGFHKDWRGLAYSLAGRGWVALMPDYPGLGTPGTHAWMLTPEEGHSLLDAPRAARKLLKIGFLSDRNAIVGHSQGGHAAISAHALHAAYGTEGALSTVVAFAPVWFSQASWGALMTSTAVALKLNSASAMVSAAIYFAGHKARLDGEASKLEPFLPDRSADVESFLLGNCWQTITDPTKWPDSLKPALGPGKGGAEIFTSDYVSKIGPCGLFNSCADPLATAWRAHWTADRPPPDKAIPLVLWGGDLDTAVAPNRQRCGIDRLKAQNAPLTACAAKGADHSSVLYAAGDWVRQHLAEKLLDAPAPDACPDYVTQIPTSCASPPSNSLKPEDP